MSRLPHLVLALAFSLSGTAALAEDAKPDAVAIEHGKLLARQNCAACHSVEMSGKSPHDKAPPFWSMSERRKVGTIAKMLLTKSGPKHSDMPNFTITDKQANDLAAWIAWVQPMAHGRRIVEKNCSNCHAVTSDDASQHPDAPPFRELGKRYPIDALQEAFAEGIYTGHPDMPEFEMTETQVNDVIVYMESLQK